MPTDLSEEERTGEPGPVGSPGNAGRRPRRVLWTAVAVGLVVVLLIAVLATRPDAGTRSADTPLLGRPVPSLSSTTVDGQAFDDAALQGKWVVVNFFATWCVPCRQEHDDLVAFQDAHREAGDATVVGVVYDDSNGAVRDFRGEEGGDWPMLTDESGRIALDFGVEGVPESFLVAPDGRVAGRIVGGLQVAALERILTEVGGPPASRP